ncbi:MAG: tyrosine-type recombinase/integrase [Microgenomates group bacterium]
MEIERLQQYMRVAGYSPRTIEAYARCVEEIGAQDLLFFLDKLARAGKSSFTMNQYHAAYKLYVTKVLMKPWHIPFPYAKRHKRLPVVLSRTEVGSIIEHTKNSKHRLLLSLAYGSGLRVSEVINIKVGDIYLDELSMMIKDAKGGKDRLSVVPEKLLNDLRNMIAGKKSNDYLFESVRGGQLTTRTAQVVFEKSLKLAGIKKPATFHSLRHSFATHLLENGVDVRYIQKLLGHASITTTQLYTKVTNPALLNIKSPL